MNYKKIVLAFDSYKGCLSSKDVAKAASEAIKDSCPGCRTIILPVADGGEGTVEALVDYLGGEMVTAKVSDPLGREITAVFGISGRLAIIESAAVCGLTLLSKEERNPLNTSTRGLGELILAAIGKGCTKFVIGLGGSATNDGGRGMVETPGLLEKAKGLDFTIACDVDNPFIGPRGASRIFGPQKGAGPEDVEILEKRLSDYALEILDETGTDVRDMPGAGAAGGLGGAFRAFFNARLQRGIDMVLETIGFQDEITGADLIITGEGCSDRQTLMGKCASGVLEHSNGIPVVLMSGNIKDAESLKKVGFKALISVSPDTMSLSEAMQPETARQNIKTALKDYLEHKLH